MYLDCDKHEAQAHMPLARKQRSRSAVSSCQPNVQCKACGCMGRMPGSSVAGMLFTPFF